jgi:hypothetical protein
VRTVISHQDVRVDSEHGMSTCTVLDVVGNADTLPGALLQTLVAR